MEDGFEEAENQFTRMVEKYKVPSSLWLDAVESELGPDGRELTRQILQGHVNARGRGDIGPSLISASGEILNHRRLIETKLQTMFGTIRIMRIGYSHRRHANVFPLDAVLNLPTLSFSFGLQRFIARRVAMISFAEVLDLTREVTGVTVGKRQGLEIVEQSAVDFDAFYDKREKQGSGKEPILVLTTDGKGIVMRPDGLREETRERAMKATPKMKTRLARGEKSNRKRMAQVASIYVIKRFFRTPKEIIEELARRKARMRRPRPSNKRVWASVEKDADDVIKAMFKEAHRRDPKLKKEWVILVDGNKHQLRLVKTLAKETGVKASVIVDIIHVIEYLWEAARLFIDETNHAECERWVEEKLERVLKGQAGKVAGSIRMSAAKSKFTKDQRKIIESCARYLARYRHYMDYKKYLKRGYPIATGVIEGACRHLVKDRMDVTGARWTVSGAESVLKLRSLTTSGDFDEYWNFHRHREHERNHLCKLANPEQLKPLSVTS